MANKVVRYSRPLLCVDKQHKIRCSPVQ